MNWQENIEYLSGDINEFEIYTFEDLIKVSKMLCSGLTGSDIKIYLMNDIIIDKYFLPIGHSIAYKFEGEFEGNNKTIYIENKYFSVLFKYIGENGVIKNLTVDTNNALDYSQSISYRNDGTIQNCTNKLNLTAKTSCGGITVTNNGIITNCKNFGILSNNDTSAGIGGIVAFNYGTIDRCDNYGNISAKSNAGGIAGYNKNSGIIINSSNSGQIDIIGNYAGGICSNSTGYIYNCYNTGSITGLDNSFGTGGICGQFKGKNIELCYNSGIILGSNPGGITGSRESGNSNDIKNCYYLNTTAQYANGYNKEDSGRMTDVEMKDIEFINLLNNNAKEGWDEWIKDNSNINNGYPILDKSQSINKLIKIRVTKKPNKETYIEQQNFDTTGMIITAVYDNETTKEITDYVVINGELLKLGQENVEIRYIEGGVTAITTQDIFVTKKILDRIIISNPPNKTTYIEGENFDKTGMTVWKYWNNGWMTGVSDYTILNGDNLQAGQTSVTISYTEEEITKTVEVEITVIERLAIEIHYLETVHNGDSFYLELINPSTTIENILENIETNGIIEIYNGTQMITNTGTKLATGMTLKISLGSQEASYILVVTGDLNGDGEMGDIDALKLARYKAGLDTNLTGAYLEAGNIFRDDTCADDKDLLKMVRVLVGLDSL